MALGGAGRVVIRALFVLTVVLFGVRTWASRQVGFGDSEALYAAWAAHPQPAYLDHPGLVGAVARAIGQGMPPTPERAHFVTSLVLAALPWLLVQVARTAGASTRAAAAAGLALAVVPEVAVGLFAMTPDFLLAPLWLFAVLLAMRGLRGHELSLLGAGLAAGIAASAKVSGLLLLAALAVVYVRYARKSFWAWAGLAAGVVVLVPVAQWEAHYGFPMLRHRFVDTQSGAGLARVLPNAATLVGGQLLYVSPLFVWLAFVIARDLYLRRREDAVTALLFWTSAVPFVPLVLLCLASPVAEPHWLAPALLALPVHGARMTLRLVAPATATAAALSAAAYAYVLIPTGLLPEKADIATELYGWPRAVAAIREQVKTEATPFDPEGSEVAIVGPHWTVCAQIAAALPNAHVGCATPIADDFDRWLPRPAWRAADSVLWVTDSRYPGNGMEQLPGHVKASQMRVRVLRGGRTTRIFELTMWTRRSGA